MSDENFEDNSLADTQLEQLNSNLSGYSNVMWYGIASIINATLTIVLWMAFNYNSTVYSFYEIMLSHQFAYWPVAIGWAAIALFDSDFTKELFKAVISTSVLGPFAGHFVGFVMLWINADTRNLYPYAEFWILWPLYLGYIVGQMLIQFLLLPPIYEWLDTKAMTNELSYFN